MFCGNCGKQLKDESQYCYYCGQSTKTGEHIRYEEKNPTSIAPAMRGAIRPGIKLVTKTYKREIAAYILWALQAVSLWGILTNRRGFVFWRPAPFGSIVFWGNVVWTIGYFSVAIVGLILFLSARRSKKLKQSETGSISQ